jgi:uncharacterized protein YndB with AHSA1/START domain
MSSMTASSARAIWDVTEGLILATVEIQATPERVFQALASKEICEWWVRPGVFDTREWDGDVRVGGHWKASGMARGRPYVLQGEFLEVDPPRKLVHTWQLVGAPSSMDGVTTVSYVLEATESGTKITLRHWGYASADQTTATGIGWETSFERLGQFLG